MLSDAMRARWVYRYSLAVNCLSFLVVSVTSVRVLYVLRSPVAYNVNVIEHNVNPFSITNVPAPVVTLSSNVLRRVADNSEPSSSKVVSSARHYTLPFTVFSDSRGSCAFINGRYYRVGDQHAYGVISRIWPERIEFSDGSYADCRLDVRGGQSLSENSSTGGTNNE